MKKLFKEPFLHFLLLGGVLFAVNAWRETKRPLQKDTARIDVTAEVIQRLRAGYARQFNRVPDEVELRGLITAHIREEVLCREALAMGLDRDDTIVRRRLAQKMEFLTDDLVTADTDEKSLREYFEKNSDRYAKPARLSFRHVYFSREKRGATVVTAALDSLAALERGVSDETLGDTFLHGYEFAEREPTDVLAVFGETFGQQLAAQPAGGWRGPITSSYGLHLVKVEKRSATQPVAFEEARSVVARDFDDERRRTANREIFERLKQRYQITVDEKAITNLPPVKLAEATR